VLDTDITFATDIGELWELFRLFTSKQVGMLATLDRLLTEVLRL